MQALDAFVPLPRLKKVHAIMNTASSFRIHPLALACLSAVVVLPGSPVLAQTAPDAGQVLRQQTAPALQAPRPATGLRLITPPSEPTLPGGAKVALQSVGIQGNTVLTEAQLLSALGSVSGQSFDMAGLRGLAEKVAAAYHDAGYPFARAFLPQQQLTSGQLTIEVVEGRYGEVKATGDAALAPQAQAFLSGLRSGDVIASASLERATLILDDQPGVKTAPVMRPGAAFGTGNLEVEVQRTPTVRGDVGYDNFGNRYTGEHRLRGNVLIDSPFMLGDQVQVSGVTTSEQLWLGSLGYSLPLGGDGLRANVGYAQTSYELGKEMASSGAKGGAKVFTAGASYPLVRSQAFNLTASATLQRKDLHGQDASQPREDWSSDTTPLVLQFDRRDALGAVNYGSLVYTPGKLKLQGAKLAQDSSSGVNANGSFNKWNLDVARIQSTSVNGLSLFGRFSGQSASKNLDSSEKFGLGGAQGVRAYPTGEGYGDSGWLAQLEVRYAVGEFSPYAFYDAGEVRINAKTDSLSTQPATNKRSISGAGVGTRYAQGPWSVDAALAWRTHGGEADDANTRRNPRAWVTATYRF